MDRCRLARRRGDSIDPSSDKLGLFQLAVIVGPLPADRWLTDADHYDLVVRPVGLDREHRHTLEHPQTELLGVGRGADRAVGLGVRQRQRA